MIVRIFGFLFLIHFVTSSSSQEDLTIPTHFHVGCLILNPEKQLINNGLQENSQRPYQTFSSPNLTIELCFRLCRRWIILTNTNHTNCICLNTFNELYDVNEHLGEVLPITRCTTDALEIHSLKEDSYILPSLVKNDDWSLEGCFRLDERQIKSKKIRLNDMNYTSSLDLCRQRCQENSSTNYVSFFLSLKQSCYCLPINSSINAITVRVPLIYCSFLPYVKDAFNNSFNQSSVHADTAVKIVVERYCSSSFVFDRKLYRCSRTVLVNPSNSYKKISPNDECSPITVKTMEQHNHLVSLSSSSNSRTFVWINRDSTYLFDDLFQSKVSSLSLSGDLCLVIDRTQSRSDHIRACSMALPADYIFCIQNATEIGDNKQSEFQSIEPTPIPRNITCPTDFILFDDRCYYIDTSPINNTQAGDDICSKRHENSTLVKFDIHQLSNTDTVEFLGRTFDDILLELFDYQLSSKAKSSTNWLRLLLGDSNDPKECVLRYFNRSIGAFDISPHCNAGGYPVCQSEPIPIYEIRSNSSKISFKLLLTMILVLLLLLPILTGIIFVVRLRRNRELRATDAFKKRPDHQKKELPTPAILNKVPDTDADGLYIELETYVAPTPGDAYAIDSSENMYNTIEESHQPS